MNLDHYSSVLSLSEALCVCKDETVRAPLTRLVCVKAFVKLKKKNKKKNINRLFKSFEWLKSFYSR